MLADKIIQCLEWYADANAEQRAADNGERAQFLLVDLVSEDSNKIETLVESVSNLVESTENEAALESVRASLMEWE